MSNSTKQSATQDFLDTNQYSRNQIFRYERIFGHTWVSTGGELTTKEFCIRLKLRPGQKVLDVGCGTGGSAFYLARQYGVSVHGIDLSSNMIGIAEERLQREEPIIRERVTFSLGDITKVGYDKESYDVIYSRDTILHIHEKEELYRTMLTWLKPEGKLLVTDYCRGDLPSYSEAFEKYVEKRGYDLHTVAGYGEILCRAGFNHVEATDKTTDFIHILLNELKYFEPTKEAFIQDFSEKHYYDIVEGWRAKIVRCSSGEQAWGLFVATK